jgi:phosphate transport system protein
MTQHFDAQIMRLKEQILDLGNLVERALDNAIRAVEQRDVELARQVVDGDREIDLAEVALGEECLHTLALYQPVASDMRYIGSVLTINKDLERIADLAVNMAEQAIRLAAEPPLTDTPLDLRAESVRVRKMVKDSLDALVHLDASLAEAVINADDEVDEIHEAVCKTVEEELRRQPEDVSRLIEVLTISRQLERIADHAVNIAEDVVYVASGEIIRHNNHPRNDLNRFVIRR